MISWEYKTVEVDVDEFQELANRYGKDGWELAGCLPAKQDNLTDIAKTPAWTCVFKRISSEPKNRCKACNDPISAGRDFCSRECADYYG